MIRSKGSIVSKVEPWYTINYNALTGAEIGRSSGTFLAYSGERAVIEWDDGKRKGAIKTTRRCDHVVETLTNTSSICTYYQSATKQISGADKIGETFAGSVPPIPSELPHMEALNYFRSGCVPKEMSLVNSLMELDDIPRMVKGLPSLVKRFNTRHVDKAVAGSYLGYEFGVKPLISDLRTLYEQTFGLQKRLKWLRRNSGKPVRVSFHKTLDPLDSRTKQVLANSDIVTVVSRKSTYHAFAVIQYDVSQLLDVELVLRQFNRSLGLTNLLSVAWEAIPFSWVIDQFLRIGSFLENLPDIIVLPYRFIDSGWSVKIEEDRWKYRSYYWPIQNGVATMYKYRVKRFHREPGIPVTFAALEGELPSLKQLALDLAAAIQKL